MKYLIIYLIGVCVTGLLYIWLLKTNEDFKNYMYGIINKAKDELDNPLAKNMDNDKILEYDILTSSIFSYFGLLFILVNYGAYTQSKDK